MVRLGLCIPLAALLVLVSPLGFAQEQPTTEGASAASKQAPLSAEERIRRATVPPPGKACPPVPEDEARAALDAEHARNLSFVTVSDAMLESALKTAESKWGERRLQLDRESRKDWESWRKASESEGMTWTSLPPCPEPGNPQAESPPANQRGFQRGLTSLVGLVLGPKRLPGEFRPQCRPGDTACEAKVAKQAAGTGAQAKADGSGPRCQQRKPPGLELYTSVRGALVPGRKGTSLLLASASNVPVSCSVDVSLERQGAIVARQTVQFKGPGSNGGIVYEVEMGFEADAYGDKVVLNSACVPRFTWPHSGSSSAPSTP